MFVRYAVSEQDAKEINRRRVEGVGHGAGWPDGAQAHVGNEVKEGDTFPALVVNDIRDDMKNLQVFLDGNDTFWATSRERGGEPGEWLY